MVANSYDLDIHEARPIIAKPNVGFSFIQEDVIKRDMLGVLYFEETCSWDVREFKEDVDACKFSPET